MREMCLDCYGTGRIKCQACGGTGVRPNISLLGEDCLKCRGSRAEVHQLCRGTGFIGAGATLLQFPGARPGPPARIAEQGLPAAA
jgi:NAD-dependent SIR2 family protein deacetylase